MKQLTDIEIIDSVKRGNQSDYSILVDRYKDRAFSLLCRMLKNQMEAEEVLQDCFLKAYNAINSFRNEAKFSTWFYRIVYNTALTRLSGKKRKIEAEMSSVEDHLNLKSDSHFDLQENEDLSSYINSLIEKLPVNYASVISMFYLDEMSCEEISKVMKITVNNVKVMLYRSRNALKDLFLKQKDIEELL